MDLSKPDFERGVVECETDIEHNSVRLFWQTRSAWGDYMTEMFASRFGVSVSHTSDMTTVSQSSFQAGYNGRTKRYIDDKFGAGMFQGALDDVESFRMKRYREHFPDSS